MSTGITSIKKLPDFNNTIIAFSDKSDSELRKMAWLFRLMKNGTLVSILSKIGLKAVEWRMPLADYLVKKTIFYQFCGGTSLEDCIPTIKRLGKKNTLTILDYGAEGKNEESEFDKVVNISLRAIALASKEAFVPVISVKISGMVSNSILEKKHEGSPLTSEEEEAFQRLKSRLHTICKAARDNNIGLFIDAEETWMQKPIDELALELMLEYNSEKAIVYNTYQLYLKNKVKQLKNDHEFIASHNKFFGAKLVRGAYMEKERKRAEDLGYPSPVNDTKIDTDRNFNNAIHYCVENHETIYTYCASHNADSNFLMATLILEKNIPSNHPHLNFCQLYGMSDFITFNLAEAGFNASKYVPYGAVKDVIPYLIRRAEENSSVTGEMGRELSVILAEIERRKKASKQH